MSVQITPVFAESSNIKDVFFEAYPAALAFTDAQQCLQTHNPQFALWFNTIRPGDDLDQLWSLEFSSPSAHGVDMAKLHWQGQDFQVRRRRMPQGREAYLWVIEAQQADEQSVWRLANYDALTNLPNRHYFMERLQQTLLRAKRTQEIFALIFLDLDRFKWVNDTLGHDVGDDLLIQVSQRLSGILRQTDTLARLGGDEFTFILDPVTTRSDISLVAERILVVLSQVFNLKGGHGVHIGASLGIARFPQDGSDRQVLLKHADLAMYQAKFEGRNAYRFFESSLNEKAQARHRLEEALFDGLAQEEFSLVYQPTVNLQNGQVVGVEALLRWHSAKLGEVSPEVFIPRADELGIMRELSLWQLQQAIEDFLCLLEEGFELEFLQLNFTAHQLLDEDFVQQLSQTLHHHQMDAAMLQLDIIHGELTHNTLALRQRLKHLQKMGVHLNLDRFGSAASALLEIRDWPVDGFKLDLSLVHGLGQDRVDEAIVKSIITLANHLEVTLMAVGVESALQISWLKNHGAHLAQGYALIEPMNLESLTHHLLVERDTDYEDLSWDRDEALEDDHS